MRTTMKKCGALLLILITSLFTLTACGNSKYVGEWKVVSLITNDGKETDIDSLSSIYADVFVTLTLEKDGTAKMEIGDVTSDVEWEKAMMASKYLKQTIKTILRHIPLRMTVSAVTADKDR